MMNFEKNIIKNRTEETPKQETAFDKLETPKNETVFDKLRDDKSFILDQELRIEAEECFEKQSEEHDYLQEKLKGLSDRISPKLFSGISLGLKMFLLSKLISTSDVQAQSLEKPNFDTNLNNVEVFQDDTMGEGVSDSTFIIESDDLADLMQGDDYEKIERYLEELGLDGVNFHTKESKLFGQHSDIHEKYRDFADDNPAFLRLGSSLYSGMYRLKYKPRDSSEATCKMIPMKDSVKANEIAKELYIEFCKKNNIDPSRQLFFNTTYGGSLHHDNLNGIDFAFVVVGSEEMKSGYYYTPSYVVALHEIGHLQRISPDRHFNRKIFDFRSEALDEIVTRIMEIIHKDYIYKKINNIPLDEEVNYSELINSDYNKGLSIGLIANTFRKLLEKYETVEECLMSQEGQEFVLQYYKNR